MSIITFVLVGVFAFVGIQAQEQEYYSDAFLHVDVKAIIDNKRLFNKYKECILEDHPKGCPKQSQEVKNILPEVLETGCAKCSPAHVEKGKEVASYICKTRPETFIEVAKKMDPTGEIRNRFEKKFGIVPECDALLD